MTDASTARAAPRVAVLMSTYNGARFLRDQIDSILGQTGVEVRIFVRDDGSTDRTGEILQSYDDGRVLQLGSEPGNLGAARSFIHLLQTAPDGFEFYAFADQDDVWFPGKLERAVNRIGLTQTPTLYSSAVQPTDSDLRPFGGSFLGWASSFEAMLFENPMIGCSEVMNAAARKAVVDHPPSEGMIMHDWWCALVLGALGETIFDPEPSLYYRQHSGNAVGGARGFAQHAVRLGRKFLRDPRAFHPIHGQAADLLQAVGGATAPAKRSAIQTLVESRNSLRTRIAYAFSPQVKRTRLVDRIVMRSLIAFGLY